jgi:hypothetical protein
MQEAARRIAGPKEQSLARIYLQALQGGGLDGFFHGIVIYRDHLGREDETLQGILIQGSAVLEEVGGSVQMGSGMGAEGQSREAVVFAFL